MDRSIYLVLISLLLTASGCKQPLPSQVQTAYDQIDGQVDFNFQVKPILSDKCFACHGPDLQSLKADLRLDLRENALEVKESGEIPIIPGNSDRSHLVQRLLTDDPELKMPPPESHLALTDFETATLIKWIDQGAEYKPHWSFIKPEKMVKPAVDRSDWPQHAIDYFVLNKMESQGYEPSPAAAKSILARRLFFNLTGLPPTLAQLEQFVEDQSADAYERMVDSLLASEAYGERMAMEWMDVARYADSDGYLDDKHRDFSPWRDWVIGAFNQNMPYDQFVTWQLAGDLLPEPTQQSILATAFNRLHRKNSEAGIVFEEYRTEYVADRTNTFGTAFLGLTVECARCHDHKYDPISQEDYYKVFAHFNSTHELGTAVYGPDQTPGPALLLTDKEQQELLDYLTSGVEKKEKELESLRASGSKSFQTWANNQDQIITRLGSSIKQGLQAHYKFDRLIPTENPRHFSSPASTQVDAANVSEPEVGDGYSGKAVFLNDYTRINLPKEIGWFDRTDPFTISLAVYPDTLYAEAGIFYHCEDLRLGLKGYSLHLSQNQLRFIISHSWPQNAIQVTTKEPLQVKQWAEVTITYDGSSDASGIAIYVNGEEAAVSIDHDQLYKGILYEPDIHTYGFHGFQMGARDKMKTFKKGGIDQLKIFGRELTALEVLYQHQPERVGQLLANPSNELLREYYYHHFHQQAANIRSALGVQRSRLNDAINEIPEIMVMGDLPEPRPTFVLDRGLYDAPGKPVVPGAPEQIMPFEQQLPQDRLGLAEWLTDIDHPLTARVFVNRIWQMHFGKGIVSTSDDFGSQGEIPSHPELLDWLAVDFMESGWDIKRLHKTIVMSATFQQSSKSTPSLQARDPENLYLSRGPSFRLKAEMIRDQALAVSGLLVQKLGGASVYPYQPAGLWDEISNKIWRYPYQQQPGEGLYRRSLYTIWKRTSPPPSMLVFDVPDRSVCRVRRSNTSTPLQALVLLNDPQYLEAARVTAQSVLAATENKPQQQLARAFYLITGRQPSHQETEFLMKFYQEELQRFNANNQDALAYLSVGETRVHPQEDRVRLSALSTVISGIMNTSDAYTLR